MKTHLVVLVCIAVLMGGCVSSPRTYPTQRSAMTQTQRFYLARYSALRAKVTDYLKLPRSATAEDIRPHAAVFLGLPENSSWEAMLLDPRVRLVLTDARRRRFARIFGLSEESSWIAIKDAVETLRSYPKGLVR